MARPIVRPPDVRALAADGHVHPARTYHGHGLRFPDVVAALRRCNRVVEDRRTGPTGDMRHPAGFIAFGKTPVGQEVRVDFDLIEEPDGPIVLVITAFKVSA